MKSEFPVTIHVQHEKPILLNEFGAELDWDSAYVLLRMLMDRYKSIYQIYLGYSKKTKAYKIGFSSDPYRRARNLSIELIHTIGFRHRYKALDAEKELLLCFDSKRIEGEWFNLDEQDIDYIKQFRVEADFYFGRLQPDIEQLIPRPKANKRFRRIMPQEFTKIVYSPERVRQIEDEEEYHVREIFFNYRHR